VCEYEQFGDSSRIIDYFKNNPTLSNRNFIVIIRNNYCINHALLPGDMTGAKRAVVDKT